jgi:hypothetical protein
MSSASIPIGTLAINQILRSGNIVGMGANNPKPNQPAAPAINQPVRGKPKQVAGVIGQWNRAVYGAGMTDCAVTYTCKYGRGFDEVSSMILSSLTTSATNRK